MGTILFDYYVLYLAIGGVIVLMNCFIAGFKGEEFAFKDCIDVFIWPLTLTVLLGQLTKLTFLIIKNTIKKVLIKITPKSTKKSSKK